MTYIEALNFMLSKASDDVQKGEGSLVYNSLSPVAYLAERLSIEGQYINDQTHIDTADYEGLKLIAKDKGIYPYEASACVSKGEFDKVIPEGTRFSIGGMTFVSGEQLTAESEFYYFELTCENQGAGANTLRGTLTPIDYVSGLTHAELTEVIIAGKDEESYEDFKERYIESITTEYFGGNVADYKNKVKAMDGIGGIKVIPVEFGGGTVGVHIQGADYGVPSTELVADIQEAVCPEPFEGFGTAPVGHNTSVIGAIGKNVTVTTTVTVRTGYTVSILLNDIKKAVEEYFLSLRKEWENYDYDNGDVLIVYISRIESAILNVEGVRDVNNTKLNGTASNLSLTAYEIPILEGVTVS